MDDATYTSDDLTPILQARVRLFSLLSEEDRQSVLERAREAQEKNLPMEFILSSARSHAAELAADAEEASHPLDEDRQQFIQDNAVSPEDRVSSRSQPRNESKAREREEMDAHVRGMLREARSARQPHERKRMRRVLMGIDQARLQRVLGREGQALCEQIREILLRSTDLR